MGCGPRLHRRDQHHGSDHKDGIWNLRRSHTDSPAAGITVTNGDGVSGNPTLVLANDLAALEGLSSTGIAVRSATDTWVQRTVTGTAAEITVTNGDGVSGNPTLSLPAALTFTGKTVTGGTFASVTMTAPALGTPASGVATNLTGTASGLTAGNVTTNANLTGPVTSVGNATTIGANQVSRANLAQGAAKSILGVAGNATANVADIATTTANQFMVNNSANTSIGWATMSGDCSLATGVITCTKTNNVAFTTNATASVGQLPGETSTGSASAGNVGEYIESVITSGSAVSLVSGTPKTITSISLTAGDWEVDTVAQFFPANTTQFTQLAVSLSLVTNTNDVTPGRFFQVPQNSITSTGASSYSCALPNYRFSLSSTTSIFMVSTSTFSVSTMTGFGIIRARRAR
jgi:hypothetical protein